MRFLHCCWYNLFVLFIYKIIQYHSVRDQLTFNLRYNFFVNQKLTKQLNYDKKIEPNFCKSFFVSNIYISSSGKEKLTLNVIYNHILNRRN